MSVDDVEVLLGVDENQPWRRHRAAVCDADALRFLARADGLTGEALTGLLATSWEILTPDEKARLFDDPNISPLILTILHGRAPSLNDLTALLAAGVDPDLLTSALFPEGRRDTTWTLRADADTDIEAAAVLPAAILVARSSMTGPMWAEVLTVRPAADITGAMVYNAVKAPAHTEASFKVLAELIIHALDDITAEEAVIRILHDGNWTAQRNGRRIMELIGNSRPVLTEMLEQTANEMIAMGWSSLAYTPAALRLSLDWGRALDAGSPPALQAVLETIRTWFAQDAAAVRAFLSLLPTWTGTLDDLRCVVGGVTS